MSNGVRFFPTKRCVVVFKRKVLLKSPFPLGLRQDFNRVKYLERAGDRPQRFFLLFTLWLIFSIKHNFMRGMALVRGWMWVGVRVLPITERNGISRRHATFGLGCGQLSGGMYEGGRHDYLPAWPGLRERSRIERTFVSLTPRCDRRRFPDQQLPTSEVGFEVVRRRFRVDNWLRCGTKLLHRGRCTSRVCTFLSLSLARLVYQRSVGCMQAARAIF